MKFGPWGKTIEASSVLESYVQICDVLCKLLFVMRGPICWTVALRINTYYETITISAKYFNFLFLVTARLCRLVGLAQTSPVWLLWAFHKFFWWSLCFFFLMDPVATYCWREGLFMWRYFAKYSAVGHLASFLHFLIRLSRCWPSWGVGLPSFNLCEIMLAQDGEICLILVWWASVLIPFQNGLLVQFWQIAF